MQALHSLYQNVLNETKPNWQKTAMKCAILNSTASIYSHMLFPLHVISDESTLALRVLTRPSIVDWSVRFLSSGKLLSLPVLLFESSLLECFVLLHSSCPLYSLLPLLC